MHRWRDEATDAGRTITRIAIALASRLRHPEITRSRGVAGGDASQAQDRRLECVDVVIEWQERMPPKGHDRLRHH